MNNITFFLFSFNNTNLWLTINYTNLGDVSLEYPQNVKNQTIGTYMTKDFVN